MTNANESVLEDDFLLVHAYLDGELDPADTLVVGRKIAANPALSAELRIPSPAAPRHVNTREAN